MCEVKFRAWYALFNKMVYLKDYPYEKWGWFLNSVDLKRMQYTGLKDKNGREIYEGDIVKILYCDTLTFVEFEEGTFTSSFKGTDHSHVLYEVCSGSEVIGNIYENPELLEGDKS